MKIKHSICVTLCTFCPEAPVAALLILVAWLVGSCVNR